MPDLKYQQDKASSQEESPAAQPAACELAGSWSDNSTLGPHPRELEVKDLEIDPNGQLGRDRGKDTLKILETPKARR